MVRGAEWLVPRPVLRQTPTEGGTVRGEEPQAGVGDVGSGPVDLRDCGQVTTFLGLSSCQEQGRVLCDLDLPGLWKTVLCWLGCLPTKGSPKRAWDRALRRGGPCICVLFCPLTYPESQSSVVQRTCAAVSDAVQVPPPRVQPGDHRPAA